MTNKKTNNITKEQFEGHFSEYFVDFENDLEYDRIAHILA
jgi:hypothetical protein